MLTRSLWIEDQASMQDVARTTDHRVNECSLRRSDCAIDDLHVADPVMAFRARDRVGFRLAKLLRSARHSVSRQ